ncbi:hypothetical protein GGR92_004637 [Spirosoma lacussanchae]|uniref:hypothetical protein n=1 Tax=Spirosoma lacussanchae TaxID=1884249 RepID=UPI001109A84A|nr:hypothetical protein [Spirosoma lacussanchae]
MVWGTTRQLTITVGRAGFWDHRGGNEFTAKTTYQDVKRLLRAGNYAGIKEAFAIPKTGDQGFGCAQQLVAAGILAGGPLRLIYQLGDRYLVNGQPATSSLFQKICQKGEEMVLKPL